MASGLQCFGCGAQFGIFKREHSCKNCGHIFCSSCASQSTAVPKHGTGKHKVCFKCYKLLTSAPKQSIQPGQQTEQNDLNKITQSRENGFQYLSSKQNVPASEKKIENKEEDPDESIRQRLLQLKDNSNVKTKTTDEDIGKRFEELSGRKSVSTQKTNVNAIQPKKTETEEVSDLLKQFGDECKLDSGLKSNQEEVDTPGAIGESSKRDDVQDLITKTMNQCNDDKNTDREIEERLAKLKDVDPSVYRNPVPDSDEDEETYNQRYLQQVLSEAFLEDKTKAMGIDLTKKNIEDKDSKKGKSQGKTKKRGKDNVDAIDDSTAKSFFSKEYEADSDEDELPWCCICNANAVLRCHGCDDDLYCKRCYREGHKDEDPEEHAVSPFRPKKKGSGHN
ncbi:abscission/NoCut checkpoint regulator-like [Actinia tenebrosa]|uniref:Abscission/NoCut checkpoint regulator-like n=1 Tax=Actinia tenebrosa TaxID=6105 RepID=A0A6P8IMM0_ACTTE|nr:abscission/NoCut checkpoint regulator-like [Actinia tenebrosa]